MREETGFLLVPTTFFLTFVDTRYNFWFRYEKERKRWREEEERWETLIGKG